MAQDWQNPDMQRLMQMLGMGAGLGTAAGGLFGMFNQGKNPADEANKYIGQIPGQTKPLYDPYMEAGKGALGDLQNQYKNLLGGGVQNQLGESYKESPGYQFKLKQALGAAGNAAAAGGMAGSGAHQQGAMETAEGIASQDYNDYIKNQMGLYGLGLGGEEGLNKQGFDASKGYADTLGNALSQQGAYGYAGQAGKNAGRAQGMSNIFSGLGTAGGAFLGGPAGAGMGSWLGHLFGG